MVAVVQPMLEIRPMRRSDLAQVMAIEKDSYPFPWSAGIFRDCLRVGYRCLVLVDHEEICGYVVVSMAVDEAHLLNLCVARACRRSGLATLLLDHVTREATVFGADRLYLEVRPSNRAALRLYARRGFSQVGRRPGYYPDPGGREDALVMIRYLDGSGGG